MNDPAAQLAALQRRLDTVTSSGDAVSLHLELARVARDELGDAELARASLHKLLELDPGHGDALAQLTAVLEAEADWSQLLDVLQRRATLCDTDPARVELLLQIANIAQELLEDHAAASDALREVLVLDPTQAGALAQLERIHERDEDWVELARVLQLRADMIEEPSQRAAVFERLATIHDELLGDPARAAELRKRASS